MVSRSLLMWLCSLWLIFLLVSFCLPWSIFLGLRWCLWRRVLSCGVVFLVSLRFLIRFVVSLVGLSLTLRWSLLLVWFRVSSVSVGFGFPGFCIFLLLSLFFRFLGVRRRLLLLCFLVWFLVLSTWFPGRGVRLLCCLLLLVGRLCFLLGFLPHLRFCFCFLLSICIFDVDLFCFFSSLVSVIRATWAFVAVRSDSILIILLLIPLTFTVTIVSCLFFLILGLLVGLVLLSWFSFLLGIILILVGPNVTFFLSGGLSGVVLGFLVPVFIFSVPLVLVGVLALVFFILALVFFILALVFVVIYWVFFRLTSWSWSMMLSSLSRFSGLLLLVWCLWWALSSVLCGVLFLW